jgi:ribosomal-protein-alanine N-acetyltransferase
MTLADIPQVSAIEHASFPSSWPHTAYKQELERNNLARYIVVVEPRAAGAHPPSGRPGLMVRLRRVLRRERGGEPDTDDIAGFLGMWFMVDEAHIVTVAVRPDLRRRGVGELLVAEALEMARERECAFVTLECRVSNTPAQQLYLKYGFVRAGIRKRYYTDNGEDALIMTTPRLTEPELQARLQELRRQYVERYGEVMRDA